MKFTTVFTIVAAVAATASAANVETNARRMARGLPPMPPRRRATPIGSARRSTPSGSPPANHCSTGPVQCCNSVTKGSDPIVGILSGLVGAVVGANADVGLGCSPLSVIGIGGNSCNAQTVCCENNQFNGVINIGCSPINLNL